MDWQASIHSLEDDAAQARWRALWETSPQRSSFSSLAYAEAAATAFGLRCEMHLVGAEGRDEAGALVWWRQRGPYRVAAAPPFTQYSPLVLRQPPAEADVHARRTAFGALLAALERRFDLLRFFIAITDVRPALWRGWHAAPRYTYHLALDDEADLLSRWSSATRRTFRKHRAAYRVAASAEASAAVVRLCEESYARHGRALPADAGRLGRLVETMAAQDQVRLFTATPAGRDAPEAGMAVLHDGRTAHYWIAGSTPGPAMTVLLGEALPRLHAEGLARFDFVGANTPSIAEFKRHFGPTLTPYFYLTRITRPTLRLLNRLRG